MWRRYTYCYMFMKSHDIVEEVNLYTQCRVSLEAVWMHTHRDLTRRCGAIGAEWCMPDMV